MGKMSKEQAVKALKEQIKNKRAEMSPSELEEMNNIAQRILSGEKNIEAPNSSLPKNEEPYDKESAMKALKLYIENSDNPADAEKRIFEMLQNNKDTFH